MSKDLPPKWKLTAPRRGDTNYCACCQYCDCGLNEADIERNIDSNGKSLCNYNSRRPELVYPCQDGCRNMWKRPGRELSCSDYAFGVSHYRRFGYHISTAVYDILVSYLNLIKEGKTGEERTAIEEEINRLEFEREMLIILQQSCFEKYSEYANFWEDYQIRGKDAAENIRALPYEQGLAVANSIRDDYFVSVVYHLTPSYEEKCAKYMEMAQKQYDEFLNPAKIVGVHPYILEQLSSTTKES